MEASYGSLRHHFAYCDGIFVLPSPRSLRSYQLASTYLLLDARHSANHFHRSSLCAFLAVSRQ